MYLVAAGSAALLAALCVALGRAFLPAAGRRDRLLAGATLGAAAVTLGMRLLGGLGLLVPWAIPLGLALAAAAAAWLARRTAPAAPGPAGWRRDLAPALLPLLVGGLALGLAALAALLLPVWQWDALGYHLPFVDLALQARSLAGVPRDVPYLSTYPHGVELLFAALRLVLPDDRLVDLGQVPFGLLGAGAAAGLARRAGARPGDALAAGSLWLALPAVFLQLPSNYVDVAAAAYLLLAVYWVLAEPVPRHLALAALALGLLLGSKPTAPIPAALLAGAALARAWRAGRAGTAALLLAGGLATGAESYLVNLARHGNPLWPVALRLGPLHLPGGPGLSALLASGARAPRLEGPLPLRVVRSWLALAPAVPAFDMRVGGFGPAFALAALPAAAVALLRRPSLRPLALAGLVALATPDPAVARYTLAFPAVCLALAAAGLQEAGRRARALSLGAAAALAAAGLATALPGLTGVHPPPWRAPLLDPDALERTLVPDGPPGAWVELRRSLAPGETVAYDSSFELPHLLWRPDLANRVVYLAPGLDEAAVERSLEAERVSVLVAGRGLAAGRLARAGGARFRRLFPCQTDDCDVWLVERPRRPARPRSSGGGAPLSLRRRRLRGRLERHDDPEGHVGDEAPAAQEDAQHEGEPERRRR